MKPLDQSEVERSYKECKRREFEAARSRILKRRKKRSLKGISLRELIDEGRQ